ncbi:MAG: copper-binding protein [Burkholderiaceae bacterium]
MKRFTLALPIVAMIISGYAFSDDKGHQHAIDPKLMNHGNQVADSEPLKLAQSAAELADGEIKRISKGSKKLTIKHGEIKSLDMPPMTMSFGVSDEKMLEMVKKGDKVKFKAETVDGKMVVTEIVPQ